MTKLKMLCLIPLLFYFCNLQAIDGLLFITTDYTFQDKWYKTVSSNVPQIMTTKEVFRGQNIYAAIVVGAFELDEKRKQMLSTIL